MVSMSYDLQIIAKNRFQFKFHPDLLGGIGKIKGQGQFLSDNKLKRTEIILIPYYAWSHRDISPMTVWLREN